MAMKRVRELKKIERATDKFREEEKVLNSRPLEYLKLSLHSKQCLCKAGINTVEALLGYSEQELTKLHTLGKKGVKEIKEKLKAKGMTLNAFDNDREIIMYAFSRKQRLAILNGFPNARQKRRRRRQKLFNSHNHHLHYNDTDIIVSPYFIDDGSCNYEDFY